MSLNKELGEVVEYRGIEGLVAAEVLKAVSYTHLRAHET